MKRLAAAGVLLTSREYTDFIVGHEREIREERERAARERFAEYIAATAAHLVQLNGEAARIKAVLDVSVTTEKFADYVNTQRDKVDAAEESARTAFKIYSETIGLQIAAINKQINRWGGAIVAIGTALEIWLHYGSK